MKTIRNMLAQCILCFHYNGIAYILCFHYNIGKYKTNLLVIFEHIAYRTYKAAVLEKNQGRGSTFIRSMLCNLIKMEKSLFRWH